ncbi:hypothetical protein [Shewanella sp. YIC-542]|uniref:COG4648 family protein n=1 Tax=Shewanella mytili TaxID=3377111 RepID=UPI00398E41B4
MATLARAVTFILLLGYPLAVYLGLNYLPGNVLAPLLALLLLLRLLTQKRQLRTLALPLLLGLMLALGSFIARQQHWLLYYPVVMNLCMLGLFGSSLLQKTSMVERLARIAEPQLPDSARGYLRRVTLLWCVLFVINGTMAAYTALYASLATWTLYNGLIAYLLMGILAGGEWLYRHFWLTKS